MSSSKPIIEINGISKSYKIAHQLQRNAHPTLKDDINMALRKPLSWVGAKGGYDRELIWALKDVNIQVGQGDVVGLMGRNGSGKSTLFKIISRITQPTDGRVILRGSTASLLEVGTGFHPELTGRENVYFNGAVLGMRKKEIDAKFDQIVDFSEVEKFLDTPVKFYSSGMKVRLAFSVAAFLNPEILIIDEVLAVGDVRFKKKSLDHMKKLADEDGRTILFVSHIISKIQKICTRGVVLDGGQVVLDGELDDAIEKYLELNDTDEDVGDDSIGVTSGRESIFGEELGYDNLKIAVDSKKKLPELQVTYDIQNLQKKSVKNLRAVMMITDQMGKNVALISSDRLDRTFELSAQQDALRMNIKVHNLNLVPDTYAINLTLRDDKAEKFYYRHFNAATFKIDDYEAFGRKLSKKRGGQPPVALDFDIKDKQV